MQLFNFFLCQQLPKFKRCFIAQDYKIHLFPVIFGLYTAVNNLSVISPWSIAEHSGSVGRVLDWASKGC